MKKSRLIAITAIIIVMAGFVLFPKMNAIGAGAPENGVNGELDDISPVSGYITVDDPIVPSVVYLGKHFNVCGQIKVSKGKLTGLRGEFIDSNGDIVMTSLQTMNTSSFRLKSSPLDKGLGFNKLETGSYKCRIYAEGTEFPEELLMSFSFEIVDPNATPTPTPEATPTPTPVPAATPTPTEAPKYIVSIPGSIPSRVH